MSDLEKEPFYVGEFRHNADAKLRITIPSKWRFVGDEGDIYVAWSTPEGCITVYPPSQIAIFKEKIRKIPESDPRKAAMLRRLFGKANQFGCDAQGRIKLTEDLASKVGIAKECVLVGTGETFQIWAADRYPDTVDDDFNLQEAMSDFGL